MKNVIRLVIAILLCVCMVISAEKNIKIKKIPSGSINENLNNFIEIKDGNQINYIAEKKDEIVFLNKNMKIKQSITPKPGAKLSKIIYSKKGKYILLMEHIPVDKNTDFHINYHRNLSLINHKNKIMWEKKEYY